MHSQHVFVLILYNPQTLALSLKYDLYSAVNIRAMEKATENWLHLKRVGVSELLLWPAVVLITASLHCSALDTENERWCIPSLPVPKATPATEPPDWRELLLLEWGVPGKREERERDSVRETFRSHFTVRRGYLAHRCRWNYSIIELWPSDDYYCTCAHAGDTASIPPLLCIILGFLANIPINEGKKQSWSMVFQCRQVFLLPVTITKTVKSITLKSVNQQTNPKQQFCFRWDENHSINL